MEPCERCGSPATWTMMSMLNTQMICGECIDQERQRPDYEAARQAEERAVRAGDFNFPGIGFGGGR